MPINSFIKIATSIVIGLAITGGPQNLQQNLHALKYKMAKELMRTDNWGNPSIFGANIYANSKPSIFAKQVERPRRNNRSRKIE